MTDESTHDDSYAIKVNRRDGIVEISGPDKEWIAAQLDKLAPVYEELPASGGESPGGVGGDQKTIHRRSSRRSGRIRTPNGGGRRAARTSPVPEKLTPEVQKKLTAFHREREDHFKSRQAQAAIIATFLEDELSFDGIDQYDLASVYEVMGWRAPGNARAAINNARDRNKYFQYWSGGRARLTATGKNFGRFDSKRSSS